MGSQVPADDQREPMPAVINALHWLHAVPHAAGNDGSGDTLQSFFQWACATLAHRHPDTLINRYRQLKNQGALPIIPAHSLIIERLLIPIHQAKCAFTLGHELGCIALCGMAGEMLVTLRHEIWVANNRPEMHDKKRQRHLYGKHFDRLEQRRRIEVLHVLGLVDEATAKEFEELASIRNHYLHSLAHPHGKLGVDAMRAFELVTRLVTVVLEFRISEGAFAMCEDLRQYLKNRLE